MNKSYNTGITWFDVGLGSIVKGSHPDLSYIQNRTRHSAKMNSKIYTSTSVLWSIYYSDDFFTKIYIRYRLGIHQYLYTISEKMSPNSPYYIVDFLTELSAYYYLSGVYTISEKMSPNSTYYIVDFLTKFSAYYYHTHGWLQDFFMGGGGAPFSKNYDVKVKSSLKILYSPLSMKEVCCIRPCILPSA